LPPALSTDRRRRCRASSSPATNLRTDASPIAGAIFEERQIGLRTRRRPRLA